MGFPKHSYTISMGLPIVYFEETKIEFKNCVVLLSMKVVLILAISADPDEMQHYAAFYLGPHSIKGLLVYKGLK